MLMKKCPCDSLVECRATKSLIVGFAVPNLEGKNTWYWSIWIDEFLNVYIFGVTVSYHHKGDIYCPIALVVTVRPRFNLWTYDNIRDAYISILHF